LAARYISLAIALQPTPVAFGRCLERRELREDAMDPKTTAVVLIEYQNDFTSEGGTLHQAVKPVMDSTNMLANTVETVNRARAMGAAIVHAPITFTEDYRELNPRPYGILKGVVDSKSFRKGTWGAEIVDALAPHPGDIVVEGKRGLCGFASTNLDFILRSRGITDIALGGFLTNCCVESTMRSGYEKGYSVVTLTDCTAALSEEEQRLAVEKNYPMFSRPLSHREFLDELGGKGTADATSRGYDAA
jgi:ureidoacrylate peracid hydrolase